MKFMFENDNKFLPKISALTLCILRVLRKNAIEFIEFLPKACISLIKINMV